jgi:O-acetylhomoserine (thiol)-lyase
VAFDFETAEEIESVFAGSSRAHSYSRLSNPTVEAFERKLTLLEDGFATIALSSGMAAITNVIATLLQSGDNLVASRYLFGNTYALLQQTFPNLGIETRFADIDQPDDIVSLIDNRTRLLFVEIISNPRNVVADIGRIARIAKEHGIVLVVDATLATPWLFQGKKFGADIVIHSTTKFISGGATSVGGAIVDLGTFDWKRIPALSDYHRFEDAAFLARLKKETFRNFGSCMAPQVAFLQSLGLETLSLRVDKSCQNAQAIAEMLDQRDEVLKVYYPGLPSSPYFELATRQFGNKYGGLLSFELKDKATCFKFINGLKLIRKATNINDNQTLIIHPASTIYRDFSEKTREEMGVAEGLIRLSIGIETEADIASDIRQSLEGSN